MHSTAHVSNQTQLIEFDCELMAPNAPQGSLGKFWNKNYDSLLLAIKGLPVEMQLENVGKKITEGYSVEEFVLKLALKFTTKKANQNQKPSLYLTAYIPESYYNKKILNIIEAITDQLTPQEFEKLYCSLKKKITHSVYNECGLIILFKKANYREVTPRTPIIKNQMNALDSKLLEIAKERKIQIAGLSIRTEDLEFEIEDLSDGENLEFEKEDLSDDEESELNEAPEITALQLDTCIFDLPFYSLLCNESPVLSSSATISLSSPRTEVQTLFSSPYHLPSENIEQFSEAKHPDQISTDNNRELNSPPFNSDEEKELQTEMEYEISLSNTQRNI